INVAGRLTNATKPALNFNSGGLTFLANNTAANASSAETVGAINLLTGQSTIQTGYATLPLLAGVTSSLTAGSLSRVSGATVNFIGGAGNIPPLGAANHTLTSPTAPSLAGNAGGIIPFAAVNG